jgi:hypothetical protein
MKSVQFTRYQGVVELSLQFLPTIHDNQTRSGTTNPLRYSRLTSAFAAA